MNIGLWLLICIILFTNVVVGIYASSQKQHGFKIVLYCGLINTILLGVFLVWWFLFRS